MENIFDQEFRFAIDQNQRLKAKILGFLFLGIFVIQILILVFFTKNVLEKFIHERIIIVAPFFLIGMAAIEFYIANILSRVSNQNKKLLKRFQYFGAFLEASFPTMVILFVAKFVISFNPGSNYDIRLLLNSPPVLLYFIFIILSSLQLDFWLCLFVGIIAAIECLISSFYLLDTFTHPQILDYLIIIGKSVFIFLSGLMSGIIAGKIKESVLSSLKAKNELIYNLDIKVKEKTSAPGFHPRAS